MKDTLIRLLKVFGVTGREDMIREAIRREIEPYVDEISVDVLGNLIALKRGSAPKKRVMVAAHMDQIGFIVTDIDEKGFLRVHNLGGIRRSNSLNRRVVFENGLSGVLSIETRDMDSDERNMLKLFVDIGAKDRADAESKVRLGDACVYSPDVFEMGDMVAGPALDDRAGCALLVEVLRRIGTTANDVVAVFSTQEEVGLRGAKAAAYDIEPDVGIALDVTTSGDVPKGPYMSTALGKGVAIKIMDGGLICTPALVRELEDLADEHGIAHQPEVLTGGTTDATAINLTKGGIPSAALSIACRYVHSATEVVSMADMESAAQLLIKYLEK